MNYIDLNDGNVSSGYGSSFGGGNGNGRGRGYGYGDGDGWSGLITDISPDQGVIA